MPDDPSQGGELSGFKGSNPRKQGWGGDGDNAPSGFVAVREPIDDPRAGPRISACRFGRVDGAYGGAVGRSEFMDGGETCGVVTAGGGEVNEEVSSAST